MYIENRIRVMRITSYTALVLGISNQESITVMRVSICSQLKIIDYNKRTEVSHTSTFFSQTWVQRTLGNASKINVHC